MNAAITPLRRGRRALTVLLALTLAGVSSGTFALATIAADPSPEPAAGASADALTVDGATLCESAETLGLIIGYLREIDISEDGVIPVMVGAIAGLSEARTLSGLVSETYRPLVDDLTASLQGLRASVDERGEQPTLGAQIASIGEAITAVGSAMDVLGVQLRTPCPVPDAAASPAASPAT